ncbi:MAG TPA: DNA primase [Gemmatimonadaceae bacterium]|nr:DNA primase [Gemmatimonadaceae bacterium]
MIPDDVVERVREEADIVAVVGEFVKLKRVGNSFRGPCPFHHGKNNNFSVSPAGGYKCFVCGESGDVFTFVEKHLGLDFVEAVKWVGGRVGVEVREVSRRVEEKDSREPFWEVNAAAAEFFRAQLWDAAAGEHARQYLASRGLTKSDADRFGLGYAPREPAAMRDALRTLGFDEPRLLAAGLVIARDDRPDVRARFRDRLMFPIYDTAGHVVGFGGRVLGEGEPKYLNSAESEVFSKRNLLYGLNWAKQAARKADRLIVVEGYFDAIRLMLAGIDEVVAPLGTALTEQQATLMRKYTRNVFLLYDSDQAGLKATFRSGDVLLAAGALVRVITLPDGDDPDTFVAKTGAEGFERAAAASIDVFDRKIQILQRGGWFGDLRRKRDAVDKLLPTIRVTSDRVLRDMYIARTSEVASVSREQLERELAVARRERRPPSETGAPPAAQEAPEEQVRQRERRTNRRAVGLRAERELIRALLHHRRYVEPAAERVGAETFADPAYRAIFHQLASHDSDTPIDELAAPLDADATFVLQELMEERGGMERVEETIEASINALLSRDIAERLSEIDRLLPFAANDEKDELILEKRRLAAEMQALGRPRWKHFNSTRS